MSGRLTRIHIGDAIPPRGRIIAAACRRRPRLCAALWADHLGPTTCLVCDAMSSPTILLCDSFNNFAYGAFIRREPRDNAGIRFGARSAARSRAGVRPIPSPRVVPRATPMAWIRIRRVDDAQTWKVGRSCHADRIVSSQPPMRQMPMMTAARSRYTWCCLD